MVLTSDNYFYMRNFLYIDSLKQGLTNKINRAYTLIIFGTVYCTATCCNHYNLIIYQYIILYTDLQKIYISLILFKFCLGIR